MNTGDLQYPAQVSRTLIPDQKSLIRVVGLHDRQITDADINLTQDLISAQNERRLQDQTTSGCLTYQPLTFAPFSANTFFIPAFDVLMNGDVVTVAGNLSSALSTNKVILPKPQTWQFGSTTQPAQIYIVFLELWYSNLDSTPGASRGYYVQPGTNALFYWPYGCTTPDPSNLTLLPNDTISPFIGQPTTFRAQIQWAIRVQPVALTYNFSTYRFGLDPGANASETVYAQGGSSSPVFGNPTYQFTNMGTINGDTGIWRAGDGNVNNSLISMDGYSYATPLAVVFQRNIGVFSVLNNPFGCASISSNVLNSGLITSGVSGRFDVKFADSIYPEDTVDTRLTIQQQGYDNQLLAQEGFASLVMGDTTLAIGRGIPPGNQAVALGSTLDYYVSMNNTAIANTDTIGQFDGFANGFSSDARTYSTTQQVTIDQKSIGLSGSPWKIGDSFVISMPASSFGAINTIQVQILVNQPDGSKSPALLLPGQIEITGLGTKSVTVTIIINLTGTAYDPGANSMICTVGAFYAAGGGSDLRQIPVSIEGGQLVDSASGQTLQVFGVSEYEAQQQQTPLQAYQIWTYNPSFSNTTFGTRLWVQIAGSTGTQATVSNVTYTTFILNRTNLNNGIDGLYPVSAHDSVSGNNYVVFSRNINSKQVTITLQAAVLTTSTVVFEFLANATCQVAFNPPVKGITEIDETVLAGNWTSDSTLPMDNRITIASNVFYSGVTNTFILTANNCLLKGISGDDVNQFIFVQNTQGTFDAVQISSASFQNGLVVINVPTTVNLTVQAFFMCVSIAPAVAPASSIIIEEMYIPYQGEGVLNRNYEVLYTDDQALVTTNGTGTAPIIGLADVYPYNRQLPMSVSLPALVAWPDATLFNVAVASFFDSNYVGKQYNNVETTFEVPVHTNDWIDPFTKDKKKLLQFISQAAQRGFDRALPHVGFAIQPVTEKTIVGQNVLATTAPIVLYVNNVAGNDQNNGLIASKAFLTIQAALDTLPAVLRHPCSIQIIPTGLPFTISGMQMQNSLQIIALGDGQVVTAKYYAIGNLAFTIQDSGRLVITASAGSTGNIVIDATGSTPYGDGPISAFFCNDSRVIFNQLTFKGFTNPAVYGISADIEFVNCNFTDNIQAGGFIGGCTVSVNGGTLDLGMGGSGFVSDQSELVISAMNYAVDPTATPGTFFVLQRGSSITLSNHGTDIAEEKGILAATAIVAASLNSNVVTQNTYQSNGSATLAALSVIQRTVSINPFIGGVTTDSTSFVLTSLS